MRMRSWQGRRCIQHGLKLGIGIIQFLRKDWRLVVGGRGGGAVDGRVGGLSADATLDGGDCVLVVEAGPDLVCGGLSEGAVVLGELAELLALVLVLALVDGHQQLLDTLDGGLHLPVGLRRDQHVQLVVVLVLPRAPAVLGRPAAPDGDLGPRGRLQLLLRLPPRPDDDPDEVVVRVLPEGDVHLGAAPQLHGLEVRRRLEPGAHLPGVVHGVLPLPLQQRPLAALPRVVPLPVPVVRGRRGRRPLRPPFLAPQRLLSGQDRAQLLQPRPHRQRVCHLGRELAFHPLREPSVSPSDCRPLFRVLRLQVPTTRRSPPPASLGRGQLSVHQIHSERVFVGCFNR